MHQLIDEMKDKLDCRVSSEFLRKVLGEPNQTIQWKWWNWTDPGNQTETTQFLVLFKCPKQLLDPRLYICDAFYIHMYVICYYSL